MSLRTKKFLYGLPLFIQLAVAIVYLIWTEQWQPLALAPIAGLAGIGLAAIRLKYDLFWE